MPRHHAPVDSTHPERRATGFLLLGAAVGFAAGIVIPTWSVEYTNDAVALWWVLLLLALMTAPTIAAGGAVHRVRVVTLLVLGGAIASFVLWYLTWFSVAPGMLSALWLAASASVLIRTARRARNALLVFAALALVVTTFASIWLPTLLGVQAGVLVGAVINATLCALALAAAVRLLWRSLQHRTDAPPFRTSESDRRR